jgi:raffinose/stachyose/melibiose transport system permease protein
MARVIQRTKLTIHKNTTLLACTAPALLCFAAIKLVPSVLGLWYSLTDWNGIEASYSFIGLENVREIITLDPAFGSSMLYTIRYVLWSVVLMNLTALALALAIERRRRTKGLFRTIFYLPNMISMIIGGYMWNFVFTQVVYRVAQLPGLGFLDVSWIGDPTYSSIAILTVSVWGGAGYLMIIYISALQSVPASLHEAAAIDGAGAVARFIHITLPMIRQAMTICLFITLNNGFQVFDVVYSLTGGGPGRATQVVALNIYQEAFGRSNRFGYATAKSMIVFAIVLAVTAIQLTVMKRREQEQ